jgi:hypothetical protein
MAMKIWIVVLWIMEPCSLVGGYKRFGETLFYPEYGSDSFHRNVSKHLQDYTSQ